MFTKWSLQLINHGGSCRSKHTTRSHFGFTLRTVTLGTTPKTRYESCAKTLCCTVAHIKVVSENGRGQRGTWWASKGLLYLNKSPFQIAPHLFVLHIRLCECSFTQLDPVVCLSAQTVIPLQRRKPKLSTGKYWDGVHRLALCWASVDFWKTNKKTLLWSGPIPFS